VLGVLLAALAAHLVLTGLREGLLLQQMRADKAPPKRRRRRRGRGRGPGGA
jgi:hypothetical protein